MFPFNYSINLSLKTGVKQLPTGNYQVGHKRSPKVSKRRNLIIPVNFMSAGSSKRDLRRNRYIISQLIKNKTDPLLSCNYFDGTFDIQANNFDKIFACFPISI